MKVHFFLIVCIVLGISILLPRVITREPHDADIPLRVKLIAFFSAYLLKVYFPPKAIRWIQSLKVPQSSEYYTFAIETFSYADKSEDDISIEVNTYIPKGLSEEELYNLPILLFFHGGGFVIGHPNSMDSFFKEVMTRSRDKNEKVIVVSPNYRKMPEFPADDCIRDGLETLRWAKKKYGGHRKLLISGESAGGKLTLALTYYLKNTNYADYEKSKIVSIPIYAVFCREIDCRKDSSYKNGYMTNEELVQTLYKMRVQSGLGIEVDFWFDYNDLEDLPHMVVITAEYDYLRDEAVKWIEKFDDESKNLSKPDYVMIEGEVHGFIVPILASKIGSIKKLSDTVLKRGLGMFE